MSIAKDKIDLEEVANGAEEQPDTTDVSAKKKKNKKSKKPGKPRENN